MEVMNIVNTIFPLVSDVGVISHWRKSKRDHLFGQTYIKGEHHLENKSGNFLFDVRKNESVRCCGNDLPVFVRRKRGGTDHGGNYQTQSEFREQLQHEVGRGQSRDCRSPLGEGHHIGTRVLSDDQRNQCASEVRVERTLGLG